MSWTSWPLLALGVAGVAVLSAAVLWLYHRRELAVPGRGLLAGARIAALALVVLLLLDLRLPAGPGSSPGGAWVLLDASRSMAARGLDGEPGPWERAVERARTLRDGGARVLLVGGAEPAPLPEDGTIPPEPELTTSRLVPALERAAESGAGRVVLLSDLRLDDAAVVGSTAARLGISLEVEDVGDEVTNVGVGELRLPRGARAGDSIRGEATVFASVPVAGPDPGPDSATIEVVQGEAVASGGGGDGTVVSTLRVPLPDPGLERRVELLLPPPPDSGTVRYTVRVAGPGDAFPDDDSRVAHVAVDPVEGSVVLLSTAPDWEPRFLLPVFGRVSGLPTVGYLRMEGSSWLVMEERGATRTAREAEVREAVASAEILAVQSAGDHPEWLADAVAASRRVLVMPRGPGAVALVGLEAGPPRGGEWYVAPELPPSPLAGELGSVALEGLPPVGPLLPLGGDDASPGTVPYRLQRSGDGAGEPGLLLVRGAAGRRAVTLAPGLWRWAFHSDDGRAAYERLWSGVAGWLLAETVAGGTSGVRPVTPVTPRGEPVRWIAPGAAGDSLALSMSRGDSVVLDTTVAVPPDGSFSTPPLPPGRYAFEGRAGDREDGAGSLDVEAWSGELRPPRSPGLEEAPGGEGAAAGPPPAPGRLLRTHPLPYLLVLALLCAEWVLRRRKGLR